MAMRPGKYADTTFTPDQKRARRLWERMRDDETRLLSALVIPCDEERNRERLHTKLDRILDSLERRRAKARELFPDVEESFTIASMDL